MRLTLARAVGHVSHDDPSPFSAKRRRGNRLIPSETSTSACSPFPGSNLPAPSRECKRSCVNVGGGFGSLAMDFGANGVDSFLLAGIEPAADVDPEDPTGFATPSRKRNVNSQSRVVNVVVNLVVQPCREPSRELPGCVISMPSVMLKSELRSGRQLQTTVFAGMEACRVCGTDSTASGVIPISGYGMVEHVFPGCARRPWALGWHAFGVKSST